MIIHLCRTSETFLNLLIVKKVWFSQVKLGPQDERLVQENFIPWGVTMPCSVCVKIQTAHNPVPHAHYFTCDPNIFLSKRLPTNSP